jgi:hypothetical protein
MGVRSLADIVPISTAGQDMSCLAFRCVVLWRPEKETIMLSWLCAVSSRWRMGKMQCAILCEASFLLANLTHFTASGCSGRVESAHDSGSPRECKRCE